MPRKRRGSENPPIQTKDSYKFMQTLEKKIYRKLAKLAKERYITVQEYLRVVVIPRHLGLDGSAVPEEHGPEPRAWKGKQNVEKIPA